MYRHILVPTDGSALSLKAAKTAAKLAKQAGARITALYAIEPYAPPTGADAIAFSIAYTAKEYEKGMREVAAKALAKVRAAADAEEVQCDAISVVQMRPWEAIVNAAKQKKCDLVVMASHGRRGLAGLLLGSETQKVLTHSKTPVLVCR
jgi:nucleotide-binding universal stress UspA family protein